MRWCTQIKSFGRDGHYNKSNQAHDDESDDDF